MQRWRTHTQLPMLLGALCSSEADPTTQRLAAAFGGDPLVRERSIGVPARRSRRLLFASGGEIILHDEMVAAVILHLAPTPTAPRGLDLSDWIAGAGNDATLDDLRKALKAPRHFAGFGTPYFTLDACYARLNFRDRRGWNDPGNLVSVTITADQPGLTCRPEDDECPTCRDLLVRRRDPDDGVDIAGTADALAAALAAGHLTEDAHWVRLADLQPLNNSGLMERVESQLTCTSCHRIICFTLFGDAAATFGYAVRNDAMRRPLGVIPPVEQWGDEARIAQERDAMHYVDHEPGGWFLVEQQGVLYLDARYVVASIAEDTALIRLNDAEVEAYRAGGHDYLSGLAAQINENGPHREESPFRQRDLMRGPEAKQYRHAVQGAIVNHTWLAQQRR